MMEKSLNKIVQDKGEDALIINSDVTGPIREMSFLRRALLFAELAMIAYNDEAEATVAGAMAGFDDVTYFDRDGSQAFRFRNKDDCVIACRGTEPNEWNDIKADANATTVLAETAGKVHAGFKKEVDDLWPMVETALLDNSHPLYFCGHSLGGAMATICAGRCFLSHIDSNPMELFTFGSPRVGNNKYVNHVKLNHFRFVHNNDIVTRVPPALFGYRHCGNEVYLNRKGKIEKYGMIMKRRDRWRGFLAGLKRWKIDHFADHSIHGYIDGIYQAVLADEQSVREGKPQATAEEIADIQPEDQSDDDSKNTGAS